MPVTAGPIGAIPARLYFPRISRADHCCEASAAAAEIAIVKSPPEWLRELNFLLNRCGTAMQIEGLTVREAQDWLVEIQCKEKKSHQLMKCLSEAWKPFAEINPTLQQCDDLISGIFKAFYGEGRMMVSTDAPGTEQRFFPSTAEALASNPN